MENGYSLEDKIKTGIYQMQKGNIMRITNMNDLEKYVKDPDKVILFSHVPRKFSNPNVAVDMAEFGEVQEDFYFKGQKIRKGSVFPWPIGYQLVNAGFPVKLKKENRGNEYLAKIIDETGIKKHITGHFHESYWRAHNLNEEQIKQGDWSDELFFMASYMDKSKIGIIEVDNQRIRYYKVNLDDFLK